MKPENAKPFLRNDVIRVLTRAGVSFLGIQGEISNASKPASATNLAAFEISKWPWDKWSAHASSKICDHAC